MKYQQAIRLLIQSAEKEMQKYAVDANLYEKYGVDNPSSEKASKIRKRLREAIQVVQEPRQGELFKP